jgi:hypothetical protein
LDCLLDIDAKQVLADNKLSEEERTKQISVLKNAEWNSECAFKSESNPSWVELLKMYGTERLRDVDNNMILNPDENEADMCVIVRTLIYANAEYGQTYQVMKQWIGEFSCPGANTKICAASGGPFLDRTKWVILLNGNGIS